MTSTPDLTAAPLPGVASAGRGSAPRPDEVDLDPENWAADGSRDDDYLRERPPHW